MGRCYKMLHQILEQERSLQLRYLMMTKNNSLRPTVTRDAYKPISNFTDILLTEECIVYVMFKATVVTLLKFWFNVTGVTSDIQEE